MSSSSGQRITPWQSLTCLGHANHPPLSGMPSLQHLIQGHATTSDIVRSYPPSPMLHPQNCTYRDPFPQANPDSSPAHPYSAILQLCPSKSGHRNLSHHTIDDYFFYKHHKIIRVIWLKVKELFIRNNPWIRYTLNLLTSLWSTGIHKLLVTNLQKYIALAPESRLRVWKITT